MQKSECRILNFEAVTSAFIIHTSDLPFWWWVMNEIDDKIDYEPGTPELLSFLKALFFLFLIGSALVLGILIGGCAGWFVGLCFVTFFNSGGTGIGGYIILSSLGGLILAAYYAVPRLHRAFYRW